MDLVSFLTERATFVLVAATIAVAILLERGISLYLVYPIRGSHQFFDRLRILVMSDRFVEAVALCNQYRSSPVAQVVREGLMRAHYPEEMIGDGVRIVVLDAHQIIWKRTRSLLLIAALAILSGFFGAGLTLLGSLGEQSIAAQAWAGALTSVLAGLAVAMGCGIAWGLLSSRTRALGAEIEQASIRTLDILRARFYHAEELRQTVAHVFSAKPHTEPKRSA
jgi:hypothetical protein